MASDDEMRALIANETNEELKTAYNEMLDQCTAHSKMRKWYAAWFIELPMRERVGELCFKGLSSDEDVEIGYGIFLGYQGNGDSTERYKP